MYESVIKIAGRIHITHNSPKVWKLVIPANTSFIDESFSASVIIPKLVCCSKDEILFVTSVIPKII